MDCYLVFELDLETLALNQKMAPHYLSVLGKVVNFKKKVKRER